MMMEVYSQPTPSFAAAEDTPYAKGRLIGRREAEPPMDYG
jgi:hypothetical protein